MTAKKKRQQNIFARQVAAIKKRRSDFLKRRPHRSFRLTRRRDYRRAWDVPGYWSLTDQVRVMIWSHKGLFSRFVILYALLSLLIAGLLSQENYNLLQDTVNDLGGNVIAGELSGLVQSVAIFSGVLTGAFSQTLTESQQMYMSLLFIFGWMTLVWLLRQLFAGNKKVKLRDGLYSAGSPLLSTIIISAVILVQLLPFAIALIAYGAASSVDVFSDALFTSMFWAVELLLVVLSVYWITSSFIAMIIVTLPGMYPLKALKAASDLVVGRRLRVLYRLAWLGMSIVVLWAIVILPMIGLNNISWLEGIPIVPIVVLFLSAGTMVWAVTYIYVLYRKLVSDDTPTA